MHFWWVNIRLGAQRQASLPVTQHAQVTELYSEPPPYQCFRQDPLDSRASGIVEVPQGRRYLVNEVNVGRILREGIHWREPLLLL